LKKLGATRGMFGLYRAFKAPVIGVSSSRPMKKTGANPQNGRSGNPAVEPPIRHHCPVPSRSRGSLGQSPRAGNSQAGFFAKRETKVRTCYRLLYRRLSLVQSARHWRGRSRSERDLTTAANFRGVAVILMVRHPSSRSRSRAASDSLGGNSI
jgi:hypothetical protein